MRDDHEPETNRTKFLFTEGLKRFKGAAVPKVNKQKERLELQLMQAQLAQANRKIEIPHVAVPPAPLPPPPPPGASSSDALDAESDARRKALRRTNTGAGTLFAAETGGYLGGSPANTLLG